jgi:hypothetical protein
MINSICYSYKSELKQQMENYPEDWRKNNKEYQLKIAALENLNGMLEKVGKEKFLELAYSALSLEKQNHEKQNFNHKHLSEEYYGESEINNKYNEELAKFNKKFIMKNLYTFPIDNIMRFLCTSLALGEISKEFIDAMKLSPEAPKEYREPLIKGVWNSIKEKFSNKNVEDKEKKWYEVDEIVDEKSMISEADNLALGDDFERAVEIYKSLSSIDYSKIILCYLADRNVLWAELYIEKAKFEKEYNDFFKELILHIKSYDDVNFVRLLRKNENKIDQWSTSMLLKIKQTIQRQR